MYFYGYEGYKICLLLLFTKQLHINIIITLIAHSVLQFLGREQRHGYYSFLSDT